ncbi:hypothetical protein OG689_28050 [Kitasatospora sp. NBC_00240]|uniref:hypothetical protein n=1 Tax=Kitasatospora sp. NBC_00240 TaxID=2903567 RepID=UPI00225442C0|nr:hypothetical protein [Kitasatospora sp. NBC_00240]MCX5213077.1 hypothetical protein [Kitasatospora sp. NBC_00240]
MRTPGDDFLLDALDLELRGVLRVLHQQVAAHRRASRELQGLLERLSASAPRFAAKVRRAI